MSYEREKISYNVGMKIRQHRLEQNLSQEALALGADVHPTYIGRLERGEKCPTVDTIYRIARALDIPVTALLDIPTGKRACDTSALQRIEKALSDLTAEEAAATADIVVKIALMMHKPDSR
ncbi:MAG: helix-turn-helix domain-containing protein [Oscillospiraceae bacterium]